MEIYEVYVSISFHSAKNKYFIGIFLLNTRELQNYYVYFSKFQSFRNSSVIVSKELFLISKFTNEIFLNLASVVTVALHVIKKGKIRTLSSIEPLNVSAKLKVAEVVFFYIVGQKLLCCSNNNIPLQS